MGFKKDVSQYVNMINEYDRRGEEMRRGRSYSYSNSSTYSRKSKGEEYCDGMTRDEYAAHVRSMYSDWGEEYPGQAAEALAAIYHSPV